MNSRTLLILIVAAAFAGGCGSWKPINFSDTTEPVTADAAEPAAEVTTEPEVVPLAPPPDPQIAALQQELAKSQAATERLVEENRTLHAEVKNLRFENDQMDRSLDDCKDLILERDEQRALAEGLRLDNMELDQLAKQLEAQVTVLEKMLDVARTKLQERSPQPDPVTTEIDSAVDAQPAST